LRDIPYAIGKGTSADEIRYLVSWYESQWCEVVHQGELENLKNDTVYTHETGSVNMIKKLKGVNEPLVTVRGSFKYYGSLMFI